MRRIDEELPDKKEAEEETEKRLRLIEKIKPEPLAGHPSQAYRE